ncbi:hypothetical protein GCM10027217_44050 [Pseudomaricurvus hydrocarbonicus]
MWRGFPEGRVFSGSSEALAEVGLAASSSQPKPIGATGSTPAQLIYTYVGLREACYVNRGESGTMNTAGPNLKPKGLAGTALPEEV